MLKMRRRHYVAVTTAAAIAVGLTVATLATARGDEPPDGSPIQFAPARGAIPKVTGTPESTVVSLAAKLPAVENPVLAPASDPGASGLELRLDLNVASFDASDVVKAMWEGQLFGGAVADMFAASNLPPIVTVDATWVDPRGRRQSVGGGLGNVVHDQVFMNVAPADVSAITARAKSFGFTNVQVSKLNIIQDALVVEVTSGDPTGAVDQLRANGNALRTMLGGAPTRFEGAYLEIRDATGPAYVEATAARAGAGTAWARPGLGISVGRGVLRHE